MKTIWKFPFKIKDVVILKIPHSATILHLGLQDGIPCIWALVDPKNDTRDYLFSIYGTGHEIEGDHIQFVGTLIFNESGLVFHVFLGAIS